MDDLNPLTYKKLDQLRQSIHKGDQDEARSIIDVLEAQSLKLAATKLFEALKKRLVGGAHDPVALQTDYDAHMKNFGGSIQLADDRKSTVWFFTKAAGPKYPGSLDVMQALLGEQQAWSRVLQHPLPTSTMGFTSFAHHIDIEWLHSNFEAEPGRLSWNRRHAAGLP